MALAWPGIATMKPNWSWDWNIVLPKAIDEHSLNTGWTCLDHEMEHESQNLQLVQIALSLSVWQSHDPGHSGARGWSTKPKKSFRFNDYFVNWSAREQETSSSPQSVLALGQLCKLNSSKDGSTSTKQKDVVGCLATTQSGAQGLETAAPGLVICSALR